MGDSGLPSSSAARLRPAPGARWAPGTAPASANGAGGEGLGAKPLQGAAGPAPALVQRRSAETGNAL